MAQFLSLITDIISGIENQVKIEEFEKRHHLTYHVILLRFQ